MQTCTKCSTQSPDNAVYCENCHADLREWSTNSVALKHFQENPRIRMVRIMVANDCCPACQEQEGVYPKESTPSLPVEGCSQGLGCRCTYQPILDEIYP
ncbi:MAG TPA: hypothetical protein VF498_01360 [Anaerolineales bacterium]